MDVNHVLNRIGKMLAHLSRNQDLIISNELKRNGFPVERGQLKVYIEANFHDGMSQRELADKSGAEKSVVTKIIRKLGKNGLVEVRKDTVDKRIQRVYLTEKSKAKSPLLFAILEAVSRQALVSFSQSETEQLCALLSKLDQNFTDLL